MHIVPPKTTTRTIDTGRAIIAEFDSTGKRGKFGVRIWIGQSARPVITTAFNTEISRGAWVHQWRALDEAVEAYDNGGKTLDRYTIVFKDRIRDLDGNSWIQYIGCNTPDSFWQHGEIRESEFGLTDRRIDVSALPAETQQQIFNEIQGE